MITRLTLVAVLPWIIGSQFWTRMMMASSALASFTPSTRMLWKYSSLVGWAISKYTKSTSVHDH